MKTKHAPGGMRRVFPTKEVAHSWANQTQEEAKNHSGSVFFRGPSIYSYGHHFEMGRIVRTSDGEPVALLTTRSYSATTAKHQYHVRAAVLHLDTFTVPTFEHHEGNAKHLLTEIEDERGRCLRALDPQPSWVSDKIRTAFKYVEIFKVTGHAAGQIRIWERRRADASVFTAEQVKKMEAKAARYRERAERRNAERQARWDRQRAEYAETEKRREAERREKLEAWTRGEASAHVYDFGRFPVRLRLSADGNEIETSHGARVGRRAALALWERVKAAPLPLGSTTLKINGFPVKGVNSEGELEIGCHKIPRAELERLAKELNA